MMISLYDNDEKTNYRYVVGCPWPHPVERLPKMEADKVVIAVSHIRVGYAYRCTSSSCSPFLPC